MACGRPSSSSCAKTPSTCARRRRGALATPRVAARRSSACIWWSTAPSAPCATSSTSRTQKSSPWHSRVWRPSCAPAPRSRSGRAAAHPTMRAKATARTRSRPSLRSAAASTSSRRCRSIRARPSTASAWPSSRRTSRSRRMRRRWIQRRARPRARSRLLRRPLLGLASAGAAGLWRRLPCPARPTRTRPQQPCRASACPEARATARLTVSGSRRVGG
mmetsp:Transcript_109293/g.303979  ORF Transcript_109293/g.303979 Transcript_109293/m.303979 type:complete len:218 (+) Transcript_109293:919-1572(+)